MTQADRDRLVTLRKAKKRLITQRQAAEELGLSVRQVKRLVYALKKRGDKAVIHGLRGKPSNQRIGKSVEEEAIQILSADLYKGFGPTLAAEYLADKHDIEVSKETLRQWMIRAKLWRAKDSEGEGGTRWRPRRSRASGTGAVGHFRARLAGRARREAVPDRHDRRCDEPVVGTVRAARFDRREHEAAVALPGEVRSAAGVLYGQGQYLPDRGEARGMKPGTKTRWRCHRLRSDARCRNWESPGYRRTVRRRRLTLHTAPPRYERQRPVLQAIAWRTGRLAPSAVDSLRDVHISTRCCLVHAARSP